MVSSIPGLRLCCLKIMILVRTFGVIKNHTLFFCLHITWADIRSQKKNVLSIWWLHMVTNIPQRFVWVCMGYHNSTQRGFNYKTTQYLHRTPRCSSTHIKSERNQEHSVTLRLILLLVTTQPKRRYRKLRFIFPAIKTTEYKVKCSNYELFEHTHVTISPRS